MVDQSPSFVIDCFGAAADQWSWSCSELHTGIVGVLLDAGKCRLERAILGERNCPNIDTVAITVLNHKSADTSAFVTHSSNPKFGTNLGP